MSRWKNATALGVGLLSKNSAVQTTMCVVMEKTNSDVICHFSQHCVILDNWISATTFIHTHPHQN